MCVNCPLHILQVTPVQQLPIPPITLMSSPLAIPLLVSCYARWYYGMAQVEVKAPN